MPANTSETKSGQSIPTSLRLTPDCTSLMESLAAKMGLKKTGVVELAVRLLAEREGVEKRHGV